MRSSIVGDIFNPLFTAVSTDGDGEAVDKQHRGGFTCVRQLPYHDHSDSFNCQNIKYKQDFATGFVWRQRIGSIFYWVGKRNLDIYMVHGLVLNVLMPEIKPEFPSIAGYGLICGNFAITVFLSVINIILVSQSKILKKVLGIK